MYSSEVLKYQLMRKHGLCKSRMTTFIEFELIPVVRSGNLWLEVQVLEKDLSSLQQATASALASGFSWCFREDNYLELYRQRG
jgi:hypothetical protein